jgi:hypothetical protein
MCKNNTKFIYLAITQCICKFEQHKQPFLNENYKQTLPNKKHKQSFPSENYNPTRHAHGLAMSTDSIPPRSL